MRWQQTLVAELKATPGVVVDPDATAVWQRVGGSTLSPVWSLALGPTRAFVKQADATNADMLAAEAESLRAIERTGAIRVPRVFAQGHADDGAFLALEWLDLRDGGRDAALGRALAALHATTAPRYGANRDNTIGTTPQANAWHDDWAAFWRDRRLAPQLDLAERNGHARLRRNAYRLLDAVPALLANHCPAASLLHGDLWSGNAGQLADGTPVVYDPACYYGDREADLAMTELFGGFAPAFYAAYAQAAPLPDGYPLRRTLYNLYHVLNHLNLFGAAYLARAERMIRELVAAAG